MMPPYEGENFTDPTGQPYEIAMQAQEEAEDGGDNALMHQEFEKFFALYENFDKVLPESVKREVASCGEVLFNQYSLTMSSFITGNQQVELDLSTGQLFDLYSQPTAFAALKTQQSTVEVNY